MKKTVSHIFADHLRGIRLLRSISGRIFPVVTLNALFSALTPYVTVFFSARILTELAGARRAEVLWRWVIAAVAAAGVLAVIRALLHQRSETLTEDLWGRKELQFCRKKSALDYAGVDRQELRDLRAQIAQNENWSGWGLARIPGLYQQLLESLLGILSGVALTWGLFTAAVPDSAGWLTALNSPLCILLFGMVLVGVSLLAGQFAVRATRCWSSVAQEATEGNRLFDYFSNLCTKKERAADMRIYRQQRLIDVYWMGQAAFGTQGHIGRLALGPLGIYSGLGAAISALVTGFVYAFTCLKAWAGAFDVGRVTQYVGAATAMAANLYALMQVYGSMSANTDYLDQTFAYLDVPNAMYQGSLTTEKRADRQYEVEFRNVSFRYPGSSAWALQNVSMKFQVGRRLAIVGENGSGKTTFIKLLCRLYDPTEGQILLNGIDIRKYDYRDYMDIFSVVFQDFQLLSQSLGSNVAGSGHYDRERARRALIDAGFGDRLRTMPQGLDTQLYRDFGEGGVEISGGEAQKIAIARAQNKAAPYIILDAPTAALDPMAEAEIYSKFNDIAGDKTAIYISHRLSSCKFCDEIAVFDHGAVIQQGTHAQLLADRDGKYCALWHAQAQYYTENREDA